MVILTHTFRGSAYPACRSGWGPGFLREPETDRIAGAFRVVDQRGDDVVIGNGEEPEQFWVVDFDEWEEYAEEHNPASPAFIEAIENPTIRAGLRRTIAEGRALACRCGAQRTTNKEDR